MITVSFDFDKTVWDQDRNDFIWQTVWHLWDHVLAGDRVIVVTSRIEKWIPECHEILARIGLCLDVFSAPGNPLWDTMTTKSDVLLAQSASVHWDDCPDWEGLDRARDVGVRIITVPHIDWIMLNEL